MTSESPSIEKKLPVDDAYPIDEATEVGSNSQVIYIDPEKEKAVFKKFDRYVVPVSSSSCYFALWTVIT